MQSSLTFVGRIDGPIQAAGKTAVAQLLVPCLGATRVVAAIVVNIGEAFELAVSRRDLDGQGSGARDEVFLAAAVEGEDGSRERYIGAGVWLDSVNLAERIGLSVRLPPTVSVRAPLRGIEAPPLAGDTHGPALVAKELDVASGKYSEGLWTLSADGWSLYRGRRPSHSGPGGDAIPNQVLGFQMWRLLSSTLNSQTLVGPAD